MCSTAVRYLVGRRARMVTRMIVMKAPSHTGLSARSTRLHSRMPVLVNDLASC